jgi:hypothetical protein
MKTLQQEIVEALNDAYSSFLSAQDDFTLFSELKRLAAKVESARCENCEYFDSTPPTGCVYQWSGFDTKGAAIDWCETKFGCWHFETKVK